jgi:hypothetical protein
MYKFCIKFQCKIRHLISVIWNMIFTLCRESYGFNFIIHNYCSEKRNVSNYHHNVISIHLCLWSRELHQAVQKAVSPKEGLVQANPLFKGMLARDFNLWFPSSFWMKVNFAQIFQFGAHKMFSVNLVQMRYIFITCWSWLYLHTLRVFFK